MPFKSYIFCFFGFFLMSCDASPDYLTDLRRHKDTVGNFVGKGLTVAERDTDLDWYVADFHSTALKNASLLEFAPENDFKFVRSYKFYDGSGLLWSWTHSGRQFNMIYSFVGPGTDVTIVENTHHLTDDEIIIALYFEDKYQAVLNVFEAPKWRIVDQPITYQPEALGFLDLVGDIFQGKVATLPYVLIESSGCAYLEDNQETCTDLPAPFKQWLTENATSLFGDKSKAEFGLKVVYNDKAEFSEVIAAYHYSEGYDKNGYPLLSDIQLPIAKGYLNEGSRLKLPIGYRY
ncbi:hypothetical protein [Motilimonas sp. E26]|uniref:hypothetical protein n=1 Tax=Motilimonas sp. E26 TaxID=2865674 RepID=UPI001E643A45|nr:hypothetical protein [Motilimonas sp. E26]MCE0558757.1 hypothetical protein [Motilimonas sp. E26]